MTTKPSLPRGRRHSLAAAAFQLYTSGQSERDALDNTLAGKSVGTPDREAIEVELRGMIEGATAEAPGPDLAVVPDADGSLESPTPPAPAKGERRSAEVRLAEAVAALEDYKLAVLRLQYLVLADRLAADPKGKPAARSIRALVEAGFWAEAEAVARRGCAEVGVDAAALALLAAIEPAEFMSDTDRAEGR